MSAWTHIRGTGATLAVATLAIALGGCAVFKTVPTAEQENTVGDVTITATICASGSTSDCSERGNSENSAQESTSNVQLMLGFRIPTDVSSPDNFESRDGSVTFSENAAYATVLEQQYPAGSGLLWVGYATDSGTYDSSSLDELTVTPRFALQQKNDGSPFSGTFTYRSVVGLRSVSDEQSDSSTTTPVAIAVPSTTPPGSYGVNLTATHPGSGETRTATGTLTVAYPTAADTATDTTASSVSTEGATTASGAGAATSNGDNATRTARISAYHGSNKASRVFARYGRRVRLSGSLADPSDRPVKGAKVAVFSRTYYEGRSNKAQPKWKRVASVATTKSGRFRYVVNTKGPSRQVRFAYKAQQGDSTWTDTTEVTVLVSAGAKLRTDRQRVRNGHIVRFSGRLLGRPLPTKGKLVELFALDGRTWRAFGRGTLRTDSKGRFKTRYRFTHTFTKTTYRFKLRVRSESNYPYRAGYSNSVRVTVRP